MNTINKPNDNLNHWLQHIKEELLRASIDKKHPFRFVVLSTQSASLSSRYVVLRETADVNKLFVYTDARSKKIADIKENKNIQFLFFDQKKGLQVIVSCTATLHNNNKTSRKAWSRVQGKARKAYCTIKAPGSTVENPEEAYQWNESFLPEHFTVIEAIAHEIEFLQLGSMKHLRGRFLKEGNEWNGQWLVP